MKKTLLLAVILSVISSVPAMSQQIGDGYSTRISRFDIPLFSGLYETFQDHQTELPEIGWMHLFTIRHSNSINNHQLQITSGYGENDKLYFRKIASYELQSRSTTWHELATRGNNTFNGHQIIAGDIQIGSTTPAYNETGSKLYFGNPGENMDDIYIARVNTASDLSELRINVGDDYNDKFVVGRKFWDEPFFTPMFTVATTGNVGIGISTPNHKLEVAGTIRAKEVKIENSNWPDYVFSKNYKLPSLHEVARHIEENKHLPGIPSAEEVSKEGINVSEMQAKLLQKIEELTLYTIEQNKRIEALEKELKDSKVQK